MCGMKLFNITTCRNSSPGPPPIPPFSPLLPTPPPSPTDTPPSSPLLPSPPSSPLLPLPHSSLLPTPPSSPLLPTSRLVVRTPGNDDRLVVRTRSGILLLVRYLVKFKKYFLLFPTASRALFFRFTTVSRWLVTAVFITAMMSCAITFNNGPAIISPATLTIPR